MFKRKKRAPERESEVATPAEICDICGSIALDGFHRCKRHLGVVFDSKAITDAPEKRGA
jgi:hypothetical protein